MDKKKEAVGLLRQFDALCHARENLKELAGIAPDRELTRRLEKTEKTLAVIKRALAALTPEQRLILSRFYIYREKGNPQRLCQTLGVEQSSVYRRKDRAVEKFAEAIYGSMDNAGTDSSPVCAPVRNDREKFNDTGRDQDA